MRHFEELLQELLQKVVVMGTVAEGMIETAVRVLMDRNETLTTQLYARETEVNALQVEVDDKAVKLTALQQPVASDARFLFMASRIGGELERIADQTINVAQNAHYVLQGAPLKPLVDIPIMAEVAQKMVRDTVTAMINKDVSLAEKVLEEERKVDAFRDQIFRTLLTYMMADPGTIQRALSLILISRNLERIGDHASNIAEEVIYWIQGRDIRHSKAHALPGEQAVAVSPLLQAARPPGTSPEGNSENGNGNSGGTSGGNGSNGPSKSGGRFN